MSQDQNMGSVERNGQQDEWAATKTQYADCWLVWVHGGTVEADGSHTAYIKWPRVDALTVPQKVVMMSASAFAELAHFSEIGRAAKRPVPRDQ